MSKDTYYINIHSMPQSTELFIYYNGKKYTEYEYLKMLERKRKTKETIKMIAFSIIWGTAMFLRAWVFLKYGV